MTTPNPSRRAAPGSSVRFSDGSGVVTGLRHAAVPRWDPYVYLSGYLCLPVGSVHLDTGCGDGRGEGV